MILIETRNQLHVNVMMPCPMICKTCGARSNRSAVVNGASGGSSRCAHLAYIALPAKRLLRTKWNPWRQRADAFHPHRGVESEVDVLLIDSEPKALSQLASALTCRGLTVLCAVDAAEAFRAATRPHPRVVVMPNISTDPEAMREIELLCTSLDRCRRPFLIASYREGDCVNLALKDQSYMDPV